VLTRPTTAAKFVQTRPITQNHKTKRQPVLYV